MLVKDYKVSMQSNLDKRIFLFNLKGKVKGSKVENPVVVTIDGKEITQEEYNILNDESDYIYSELIAEFDVSCVINNIKDFKKQLTEIRMTTGALFDYSKNEFDSYDSNYVSTEYDGDINKYIDDNGIIKLKVEDVDSIYIKLILESTNTTNFLNSIGCNMKDSKAILLQGLTIPKDVDTTKEYSLLNITSTLKGSIDIDFSSKEISTDAKQSNKGVSIDETSHDVPVLKFNNSGIDSSKGTVEFDFDLKDTTDINIEFYVSSEARYDKFYIYLDGTVKLCISGKSSNTSIETNVDKIDGLKAEKWSIYTLKGVTSGKHTLKLEYKKDSSSYDGDDNAYIKRIFSGSSYECSLVLKNDEIRLTQNSNVISTINAKELNGQTVDILINNKDTCNLYMLKNNEILKSICTENISSIEVANIKILGTTKENSIYALLDAFYVINSELSIEEIESILKGKDKAFKRPYILSGKILSNTSYSLEGKATLYDGDKVTRVVCNDFLTNDNENGILLDKNSKCTRA